MVLNCDRATVWIVDELNNELWSKVGKGLSSTVRLPRNVGIVGYVAITGKRLNISDAYSDPRFNKEFDKKTGYKTKSILTVPIKDQFGRTTGVVQAINKHKGSFSADDEGLSLLMTYFAGVILKNSMTHKKVIVN
jgi:signal transduction protein with GAF and PtsI domain